MAPVESKSSLTDVIPEDLQPMCKERLHKIGHPIRQSRMSLDSCFTLWGPGASVPGSIVAILEWRLLPVNSGQAVTN